MAKYQLPAGMSPAAVAAMKEDLAAYRTDLESDETDMDFSLWLRTQRPDRYRTYLKLTNQSPSQ